MRTREQFLRERRSGIGGSDVAAILGLSRWKTAYQVWQEKTGRAAIDRVTLQAFAAAALVALGILIGRAMS